MFASRRKWPGALLAVPLALCMAAGLARAQTFTAQFVPCNSVTVPAALTCAATQDPIKSGGATISAMGDVTATVYGAANNTTYTVLLVSGDGTQTTTIGSLMTDAHGNGALRKDAFYKFGTVGAGNVELTSSGGEEFVTGLAVSSNGLTTGRDFEPGLVRCTDVTVPGALSSCGSDPLSTGHVNVENPDGAVAIRIYGARPNTTYTAIFVSPSGGTPLTIGTFPETNKRGNASLIVSSEFAAGTIASGVIEIQSSGTTEFETGFKVDEKFIPPAAAVSNLVQCGTVTNPDDLVCGGDTLDSGGYEVSATGQITVTLKGTPPSTNYEVYFRPIDNSGDVDTGLEVSTNTLGNGSGSKKYFTPDTINSGTLVVKETGAGQPDQFVAGFAVH
jgi:hypothetical protein